MQKAPINLNFNARPIAIAIITSAVCTMVLGLGAMATDFEGTIMWKCTPWGCSIEFAATPPATPPESGDQTLPVDQNCDDQSHLDQSDLPRISSERQQLPLNHKTVEP